MNTLFFFKSVVYEMMWKYMVQAGRQASYNNTA